MSRYTISLDEFNLLNTSRNLLSEHLASSELLGNERKVATLALDAGDLLASCCIVNGTVTATTTGSAKDNEVEEEEQTENEEASATFLELAGQSTDYNGVSFGSMGSV